MCPPPPPLTGRRPPTATIHPGVQLFTDGAQCTANFVYTDASGAVYIGQAAHCSGTGGQTDTDGCSDAAASRSARPIEVTGASQPGTLVYNSWTAMQAGRRDRRRTPAPTTTSASDQARPGRLRQGQPVGPDARRPDRPRTTNGTAQGDTVYSYGNSALRAGITLLSPKQGISLGDSTATAGRTSSTTVSPGIPGDSGSGFMDDSGKALGILSTLQIAPVAGSNGVWRPAEELAYMRSHGGPDVTLAQGTEAFTGSIVG